MSAYRDWLSLREIDEALGVSKGTAFRAFKRLEGGFMEHRDYCLLDSAEQAELIAALRAGGRLYASSLRVLLLSPEAAERVQQAARQDGKSRA